VRRIGLAQVSERLISVSPMRASAPTTWSTWRSGGTPSNGQTNTVAMAPVTCTPSPSSRSRTAARTASPSSTDRFVLALLCPSLQEISRRACRTPAPIARSAPRMLGTSAIASPSVGGSLRNSSSASAICGTSRGWTNEPTSTERTPAARSRS
jgi:hypothetical protein